MKQIRLGLIGDNIARSSSPKLHELAGQLCGLDVTYERLIPRDLGRDFEEVFAGCHAAGFRGINVTYPYKERAAALVRIEDPLVRSIGSVNTVVFEEDGAKGSNTDYSGFVAAYRNTFGDLAPGTVCMIGAGGVGKAVAFGLVELGVQALHIVERDIPKAEALARALRVLRPDVRVVVTDQVAMGADGAAGVVNCTPIGMVGYEGTAIPPALLDGAYWAFDAVYTPVHTRFLQDASAAGLRCMSGYELFFYQGFNAFEIFCGRTVDAGKLREALAGDEAA